MSARSLKSYPVWDRATRWFHWINFVAVVGLAVIGTAILYGKELGVNDSGKILLKTTHVWFGYVFALNLAWRIVWAFVGNHYARWSAILPFHAGYGAAFLCYSREMIRGDARPYLGHNPVARAMVSLLLVLLVAQAITGLVLAGTDIYYPPFGSWIASWIASPGIDPSTIAPYDKTGIDPTSFEAMRSFRSPFITVHYWVFFAILVAVVLHIAAVVVTELREGGSVVSAMFTGRKVFDHEPCDDVGPSQKPIDTPLNDGADTSSNACR